MLSRKCEIEMFVANNNVNHFNNCISWRVIIELWTNRAKALLPHRVNRQFLSLNAETLILKSFSHRDRSCEKQVVAGFRQFVRYATEKQKKKMESVWLRLLAEFFAFLWLICRMANWKMPFDRENKFNYWNVLLVATQKCN